jgi:hypothetical protein
MFRWLIVTGSNETDVLAPGSIVTGLVPTLMPFMSNVTVIAVTGRSERLLRPAVTTARSWLANNVRATEAAVSVTFGRSVPP